MHWLLKFIFGIEPYMFRTVPLSVIRNFSLYTQQWCMSYRFADSLSAGSGRSSQAVSKPVWLIPLLCVQWKTPDGGQWNWPKHIEFYSKNKFEKSVHLVAFYYKNLSRCTVTWTSNWWKMFLCFPSEFRACTWTGPVRCLIIILYLRGKSVPIIHGVAIGSTKCIFFYKYLFWFFVSLLNAEST